MRDILVNGPAYELPKLSELRVPSSLDQTDQPSLYWAPEQARRKPTPVLVYLHSWSSDYRQDNSAWHQEAVKRGWIYLHPNFRGVNRQPEACGSQFARQDVVDALDAIQGRFQVDKRRVYLAGASGGGHMALLLASYFPERFSAVSAWVGISDLADWHDFHVKNGQPDHYAQMTRDALGGPPGRSGEVDARYRERSPVFHLQRAGRAHGHLRGSDGRADGFGADPTFFARSTCSPRAKASRPFPSRKLRRSGNAAGWSVRCQAIRRKTRHLVERYSCGVRRGVLA